jgi:tRNA threonylcarbamoyladenosine biosynthesis protein TsaE
MTYKNQTLNQVNKLAQSIFKEVKKGRRIIGLTGSLGSGKTTFTKALAEAMGITSAKSPTFVIIHCYKHGEKSLYHIDLYRLEKLRELEALGLEEIFADTNNTVVVEWVDKFPKLMKQCDILIDFKVVKNNLRNVTIKYN